MVRGREEKVAIIGLGTTSPPIRTKCCPISDFDGNSREDTRQTELLRTIEFEDGQRRNNITVTNSNVTSAS
jgi:hypothetical protein